MSCLRNGVISRIVHAELRVLPTVHAGGTDVRFHAVEKSGDVNQVSLGIGDQRLEIGLAQGVDATPKTQIHLLAASGADIAHSGAQNTGSLVGA